MPLGAELVFKFALLGTGRERHVVSKGYRIVSDKLGTELNYLRVSCLLSVSSPTISPT
jgi:hypothetical protein